MDAPSAAPSADVDVTLSTASMDVDARQDLRLPGQGSDRRAWDEAAAARSLPGRGPPSPIPRTRPPAAAQPLWDEAAAAARPPSVDRTASLRTPSGTLRLPSVARAPAHAHAHAQVGMRNARSFLPSRPTHAKRQRSRLPRPRRIFPHFYGNRQRASLGRRAHRRWAEPASGFRIIRIRIEERG